jgi:hypothetical protein
MGIISKPPKQYAPYQSRLRLKISPYHKQWWFACSHDERETRIKSSLRSSLLVVAALIAFLITSYAAALSGCV